MQERENAPLSKLLIIILIIVKQTPLSSRRRLLNPTIVPLRRDRVPIRVHVLLPSSSPSSSSLRTKRSSFLLVLFLRFGREIIIPAAAVPSQRRSGRGFIMIVHFTRAAEQSRSRHQALALCRRRRRGRLLSLRWFRHERCRSAAAGHCIAAEEIIRVVTRGATFERGGGGSRRRVRARRRSRDECRNRRRRGRRRGRRRAKVGVPRRVGDRRSPIARRLVSAASSSPD